MRIDRPGVYADITIADYVADPCETPSLSSGIATRLIDRSPAHAFVAHPRLTPRVQPETFETAANFGSAVHAAVFGGPKIKWIDAPDWRTNAAKDARTAALSDGAVPLLSHQRTAFEGVTDAAHYALKAFGVSLADDGLCEATIVWNEPNDV